MSAVFDNLTPTGAGSGLQLSPGWQPLVLATLLPFHVGTGGMPAIDAVATTRTNLIIVRVESAADDTTEALATSDRVLLLRRWLSLSVAETARVLGVQRPTVYAWERGEVPAHKNAARVQAIYELANHWRDLSEEPIGLLRKETLTAGGKTLVELLSERHLRSGAIKAAMASLKSMQMAKRVARPPSAAELAARLGFRPLSPDEASRNVAREAEGRPGWRSDKA